MRFKIPQSTALLLIAIAGLSLSLGMLYLTQIAMLSAALGLVAVSLAVYVLVRSITSGRILLADWLISVQLIWYFAASLFSMLSAEPDADYIGKYTAAGMLICVAAAICLAVSIFFTKPVAQLPKSLAGERRMIVDLFILPLAVIELFFILTGRWTYGSLFMTDIGRADAVTISLSWLASCVTPMSAAVLGDMRRQGNRLLTSRGLICAGAVLIGLIWFFIDGRRSLSIMAVEIVSAYLMFANLGFRTKLSSRTILSLAVSLGMVAAFAWPAFFAIRNVSYSIQQGEALPTIVEMFAKSSSLSAGEVTMDYSENLKSRTQIIESVIAVQEGMTNVGYGRGLLYNVKIAIPQVLFPGKSDFMKEYPALENVWYKYSNVPLNDWANTWLLDSYVDFGIFGFAIYMMIALGVAYLAWKIIEHSKFNMMLMFFSFEFCLLNGESVFAAWTGTIRNVVLLAFGYQLALILLPKYRARLRPSASPTAAVAPL